MGWQWLAVKIINILIRIMGGAPEIPSPPGMLRWQDIQFIRNRNGRTGTLIIRNVPLPFWTYSNEFNTDSMDGAYDVGHAPLQTQDRDFIRQHARVGAWITWRRGSLGRFHQIVETGEDDKGWFCRTAGTNLFWKDPGKIRLDEIVAISFGLLWTEYQKDKVIYER